MLCFLEKLETMADYVKQIEDQLVRLQVSQHDDPISGLMARDCTDEDENVYPDIIELFDDYAEGVYEIQKLITILNALTESSLDSIAVNNIWQQIRDAEIEVG